MQVPVVLIEAREPVDRIHPEPEPEVAQGEFPFEAVHVGIGGESGRQHDEIPAPPLVEVQPVVAEAVAHLRNAVARQEGALEGLEDEASLLLAQRAHGQIVQAFLVRGGIEVRSLKPGEESDLQSDEVFREALQAPGAFGEVEVELEDSAGEAAGERLGGREASGGGSPQERDHGVEQQIGEGEEFSGERLHGGRSGGEMGVFKKEGVVVDGGQVDGSGRGAEKERVEPERGLWRRSRRRG